MSEEVAAAASLPSRLARFRVDLLNDARVGDYEALEANVSSLLAYVVQAEREKAETEAEMAHLRADLAAVRAELEQERRATEAERAARQNAEADALALLAELDVARAVAEAHVARIQGTGTVTAVRAAGEAYIAWKKGNNNA